VTPIPIDVIAAIRRYRERVRTQAQLARDIQHLREVARMLFEDKPDKTKAVDAVNDIAARRLATMDPEARTLLDSALSTSDGSGSRDHGDLLSALMLVNRAGHFPYTLGITEQGASARCGSATRGPPCGRLDIDPLLPLPLASALVDGWSRLASAADRSPATVGVEVAASSIAIEFDEHRSPRHRALARAARRLWAVGLREHFGIAGAGLKLVLVTTVEPEAMVDPWQTDSDRLTDQAEEDLLAAVKSLVTLPEVH
jgi:hypothetical protein